MIMDVSILEDIGLTNAEIKVYLALLELGTASAGPIIDKSNLQSSVVHMTLNKLTEKGFVSYVKEGKRNYYQAANPHHITEYLEEKKEKFEQLLPLLLRKQAQAKEKPEIITFKGIRGVKEMLYELLNAGGNEHLTFGSTKESLILGDEWWIRYHTKRAAKGIKAKLIFNESLKDWKAENKYPLSQIRYTQEGFEPLTETIIRNDKVGIIIWTEKPMAVLFQQNPMAKSYEQFFQLIWQNAK